VTGATGATGANGTNGTNGSNGTNGTNGSNGAAGANGSNGAAGSNGGKGATGATGANGSNGTNGTNGTNGSNGAAGATGATGAPGTNGSNGANGSNGLNGSNGSGGGGSNSGEATNVGNPYESAEPGGLTAGKQESGGWAATIQAPAGAQQAETEGVASFPIPLKFHAKVKVQYRNEIESKAPAPPCNGSVNEPIAEPKNFCAYRGGLGFGSKETGGGTIDKNASFSRIESFEGEPITTTGTANAGDLGVDLVFRSNEYEEENGAKTIATEAHLNAKGSWAVRG